MSQLRVRRLYYTCALPVFMHNARRPPYNCLQKWRCLLLQDGANTFEVVAAAAVDLYTTKLSGSGLGLLVGSQLVLYAGIDYEVYMLLKDQWQNDMSDGYVTLDAGNAFKGYVN